MQTGEARRSRMTRSGRVGALLACGLAVTTGMAAAAAAEPVPVRDDPAVVEAAGTAHGAWLGWSQSSRTKPHRYTFYVQRRGQPRLRVNPVGSSASSGAIERGRVIYLIQRPPRWRARFARLNLSTGRRTMLPGKVQRTRPRPGSSVTSAWPWLLYTAEKVDRTDRTARPIDTVLLYNRQTQQLRRLATTKDRCGFVFAGQVNGRYAVWKAEAQCQQTDAAYRLDLRTGRRVAFHVAVDAALSWPGVGADGTLYYFRTDQSSDYRRNELVRQPLKGPAVVVATVRAPAGSLTATPVFVSDLVGGGHAILFEWRHDLYRVVDR